LGGQVTHEEESALILRCPAADAAVAAHRAHLDLAAGVGMPAHVTVTYPFRPPGLLTAVDHRRLEHVFASRPAFSLTGIRTAWFGDAVLYVQLAEERTVRALIDAVTEAYPEHPPYAGAFADVVPHLTIGHDHDVATLRAAADAVSARLPFVQEVGEVELWAGPDPSTRRGLWHVVRSYPLR
jgi:2'-5' RNA ligase